MPKVTTSKRLLELIKRSGLVSTDRFNRFLERQTQKNPEIFDADPERIATELVSAGLISEWQIEQILKGKYRGFRLGKYTLLDHLGTGGMSSVYLSEHPIMRRPVAIKVLPKSRVTKSSYLERFELEARAVAALDHPNIVRAYDIDNDGDTHYIVMEYVEGLDFQRIVEADGPLGFERAAEYIRQAAAGIQHAHEEGVIHRDIKPANCLVDQSGTVKVLDMGLVKFSEEDQTLSSVHKDSVVGTADYLAPEQAVNSSQLDYRADIYGLGGTLYFLLTGHAPFPTGTLTERLLKHQKEEPASIFDERPDTPATLVDICRRMMAKKVDERIQSAEIVREELASWLKGRTGGKSESNTGLGRLSALGQAAAGNRWQEMIKTKPIPKTPDESSISDTISAAEGDTARILSNDELSLAPLEEENVQQSSTKSGSSDSDPLDEGLDVQVLSRIEEEIGHSTSTSGSLIDLLEGPRSVSTSNVVLKRNKKEESAKFYWIATGIGVVSIVILIALLAAFF